MSARRCRGVVGHGSRIFDSDRGLLSSTASHICSSCLDIEQEDVPQFRALHICCCQLRALILSHEGNVNVYATSSRRRWSNAFTARFTGVLTTKESSRWVENKGSSRILLSNECTLETLSFRWWTETFTSDGECESCWTVPMGWEAMATLYGSHSRRCRGG